MSCYIVDFCETFVKLHTKAAVTDAKVTKIILTFSPHYFSASADLTEFDQLLHAGGNGTVSLPLPSLINTVQLI